MSDPIPSPSPAPARHHPEPRANGPRGVAGADGIDDATLARWAEIAGRRWTTWTFDEVNDVVAAFPAMVAEVKRLHQAIAEHHAQKADDRCIEDDDRLYAAAGLPPCDRRVGDPVAMLTNCARFIANRCEAGGPWKSYAELEAENGRLRAELANREPSC